VTFAVRLGTKFTGIRVVEHLSSIYLRTVGARGSCGLKEGIYAIRLESRSRRQ
jgi:hypothetical protein